MVELQCKDGDQHVSDVLIVTVQEEEINSKIISMVRHV